VVPEERKLERVEIQVNDVLVATLDRPPWRTTVVVPQAASPQDVIYMTAVAVLDDGTRAEDVRFLNVPDFVEQVEVDLVELYTTVTDKKGGVVLGLGQSDFSVLEDGRPQLISKFELVDNLPLSLGITIDTSGSMIERLGEARRAAQAFLQRLLRPADRSFAVAFSNRPELISPRTADGGAVAQSLDRLQAQGATALHDAVVTSLYYFRGIRGRRALVLLSDGEDTSSTISHKDALDYARRSGVAIYSIGLGIGRLELAVRDKLSELANETGGRVFFINKAEELETIYAQIERELRSQYLLAYASDQAPATPAGGDTYRRVEVAVRGGGTARTIRGYYP
jgi:VWFA-related protein